MKAANEQWVLRLTSEGVQRDMKAANEQWVLRLTSEGVQCDVKAAYEQWVLVDCICTGSLL